MRELTAISCFVFMTAVASAIAMVANGNAAAAQQDCRTRTYDSCMRGSDVGNEACVALAEGLCR